MCDRQKGIQAKLALEFPNAHVRFCIRHILANVKAKHQKVDFSNTFWAASRASSRRAFKLAMESIKKIDTGV